MADKFHPCGQLEFCSGFDSGNLQDAFVELGHSLTSLPRAESSNSIPAVSGLGADLHPLKSVDSSSVYFCSVCCDNATRTTGSKLPTAVIDNRITAATCPEQNQAEYRMRYYFAVRRRGSLHEDEGSIASESVILEITNLNLMLRCYTRDLRPLVCMFPSRSRNMDIDPQYDEWSRLDAENCYTWSEGVNLHLRMKLRIPCGKTLLISSHLPHSYTSCQNFLKGLEDKYCSSRSTKKKSGKQNVYFHREWLTTSVEGLRVDLLTITSANGVSRDREALPGMSWRPGQANRPGALFPERSKPRPHKFPGKRYIFLTGRVHPGETPASYVLNGIIKFLVSSDPQAKNLREVFAFKIIPMLNPDGVRRGNFRLDSRGVNLNRCWYLPSRCLHPSIWAAKEQIRSISTWKVQTKSSDTSAEASTGHGGHSRFFGVGTQSLVAFLDFHSMSMRPGVYAMCNGFTSRARRGLPGLKLNHAFCKLCSLFSSHFNYDACTYGGSGGSRRHRSKRRAHSAAQIYAEGSKEAESMMAEQAADSVASRDWKRIKEDAARRCGMQEGSKLGAARVCIAKEFSIVHSYTIEASCNVSKSSAESLGCTKNLRRMSYSGHHFENVGKAISLSLLEIYMRGENPTSLQSSSRSIVGLPDNLLVFLKNLPPHRQGDRGKGDNGSSKKACGEKIDAGSGTIEQLEKLSQWGKRYQSLAGGSSSCANRKPVLMQLKKPREHAGRRDHRSLHKLPPALRRKHAWKHSHKTIKKSMALSKKTRLPQMGGE